MKHSKKRSDLRKSKYALYNKISETTRNHITVEDGIIRLENKYNFSQRDSTIYWNTPIIKTYFTQGKRP